jgi:hypothetical protein
MNSRQRKPIAERQIIKQADQNRKRMTEKNPTKWRKALAEMRSITENPVKCKSLPYEIFDDRRLAGSKLDKLRSIYQSY